MYLSAERLALANREVRETFSQTCIAWHAIPQWDIGDPGQTRIRSDAVYLATAAATSADSVGNGPLGGASLGVIRERVPFFLTLAQACAPNPDALFAAITARTAELAAEVDALVVPILRAFVKRPIEMLAGLDNTQYLLNELIDARVRVEDAGYRAPSCLLTNKAGLKALSTLDGGYSVLPAILDAANINSLHRVRTFDLPIVPLDEDEDEVAIAEEEILDEGIDAEDIDDEPEPAEQIQMVVVGRRQLIPHGGAASASPGEEPVDLAVSVSPSVEVVGENAIGNIELAVRVQFAVRVKDVRGLIAVLGPPPA